MKRPLWVIGLAYAAGLLVAALAGLNTSLWLGVVCLLLLAGALLFPTLRRRAAVTAVLLAVKVHPTTYWQLIPPGLIFVAVYAVCMWLFGLNRYERSLITAPLRRLSRR